MGQSASAADAQVARIPAYMLGLGGAYVKNGATSNPTSGDETSAEPHQCQWNSGKTEHALNGVKKNYYANHWEKSRPRLVTHAMSIM